MADVQVTVGFRRKPGGQPAVVFVGFEIRFDDGRDEVGSGCGFVFCHLVFPWQINMPEAACNGRLTPEGGRHRNSHRAGRAALNIVKKHKGCQIAVDFFLSINYGIDHGNDEAVECPDR
jgi:hypothetical protein